MMKLLVFWLLPFATVSAAGPFVADNGENLVHEQFTPEHAAQLHENLASLAQSWGEHHFTKVFQDRELAGSSDDPRACGETIGYMSSTNITEVGNVFLDVLLTGELAGFKNNAKAVLLGGVKYDIQVIKVCQSCQEAEALDEDFLNDSGDEYGAYRSYCGEDAYGYDARHSGLMFVPLDPNTPFVPVLGKIRGLVAMHGALIGVTDAPTEFWPRDFDEILSAEDAFSFIIAFADYLECILGTASGIVCVMPDYLGYGETQATHNRTDFYQPSYMQAAAQTWLAAKTMITNMTNGCTLVDPVLTVSGASEGGYASIPAAAALERLGNRIYNVYSQIPILDLQAEAEFIVASYLSGAVTNATNNIMFQEIVPWLAFVFSIETPGLANTGTGQVFASEAYMEATDDEKNVIAWFANPDPYSEDRIFQLSPEPALLTINQAFVNMTTQAIEGGLGNPCSSNLVIEGMTDKLCETLAQGSLWGVLKTTVLPVKICYSANDTVTAPSNFPEFIFANENVVLLNNILGVLKAEGDHFEANIRCSINPGSSFTNTDPNDKDPPNLIQNLTDSQMEMCSGIGSGAFSQSLMFSSLLVCSIVVALL